MKNPLLVPDVRELIHAGETAGLREFFAEYHPANVAGVIEDLDPADADAIFGLLDERAQADVMSYLERQAQVRIVEEMPPAQAAGLLHVMSHDERADLVNRLDEGRVDQILRRMAHAEREDIRRLASYEPGTAGAVMTTDYVTLPPHITVHEAKERLRHEAPDRETIYTSYVVDAHRRLIGYVTLQRLMLARPSARVEDVMQRDVISASLSEDQESVARKIDKFDLIAIPVVDGDDRLVGIVTHDDAIDILRQEQTEDILAFGGVAADAHVEEGPYGTGRIVEAVRRRIGWLLMLFLAGTLTKNVSTYFRGVQVSLPDLADFVPLMIGTGGNAGSQAVGTIIRSLALGEIHRRDAWRVWLREFLTGLALGTLLGTIGFVYSWLLHGNWAFASVIGLAILFICVWANCVGALVPMLARRFGIDPAVVSAPLISTLVDATGLVIYYTIAILVLRTER
jgi:magnesium transporter